MPNFYIIVIVYFNNDTETISGQLNTLSGAIPEAKEKLNKLLKTLEAEKNNHYIKDYSIDYES